MKDFWSDFARDNEASSGSFDVCNAMNMLRFLWISALLLRLAEIRDVRSRSLSTCQPDALSVSTRVPVMQFTDSQRMVSGRSLVAAIFASNTLSTSFVLNHALIAFCREPQMSSSGALFVIGGSSFLKSKYFADFEKLVVDTPHGAVQLRANKERTVFFCQVRPCLFHRQRSALHAAPRGGPVGVLLAAAPHQPEGDRARSQAAGTLARSSMPC